MGEVLSIFTGKPLKTGEQKKAELAASIAKVQASIVRIREVMASVKDDTVQETVEALNYAKAKKSSVWEKE